MIPVFLITGFLGSGKTSFLRNVIEKLSNTRKLGFIINEFAPAGVDGQSLSDLNHPFILKEINNGSISCTCRQDDFIDGLNYLIANHNPEIVFVETSGLSDPIAIAEYFTDRKLTDKAYLAHIWCLVDSANYSKISQVNTIVQHQVMAADEIIINKTDLMKELTIAELAGDLSKINPIAKKIPATFSIIDFIPILTKIDHMNQVDYQRFGNINPFTGRPSTQVGVIKSSRTITKENANQFMKEFMNTTFRIKGYFKLNNGNILAVQSVFDRLEEKEIPDNGLNTVLIALGDSFIFHDFSRRYRELTN